jgi:hypothetical protein
MNMSAMRKAPTTKSSKKKTTKRPAASAQSRGSSTKKPLISKQPQLMQQAAVKSGMFLYTDDAWALRYFNTGDLHCEERELFG